ncbi:alpha/beta fold hydrolase [Sphingorhabdus sp. M41]|uniref:alpha/beta fold hydrolase n=1 Tax=Sphingorhabdus sp. M41 TaxID=1806885 RepID=UPI00078C5890|nr:alpha/beta hydrolase [Sphingorhabdus sp. M41]AMO72867.1 alpha/beta hydrolase [Sphingorhabdus sp. M41]
MKYADHVYRSADDRLDLYARIYDGEGPPLLLMHGLTRNSGDFEALAGHLAGKYQLIVPDQRGRGRSGYDPDPQNYTPAVYVEDMFALIDGLQLGTMGLIGTSMGGLMAMMMAAMQPERFDSLILNDIGPAVEATGLARIQSYVGQPAVFDSWQQAADHCRTVQSDNMIDYGAQDWMIFARHTCEERPDGKIRFAYDPAISDGLSGSEQTVIPPDLWPIWDTLSALPVLVIRGALSDILSPATVAEMERRHPDHFSAVDIEHRGHTPMLDEPDALAAIDRFYAEPKM